MDQVWTSAQVEAVAPDASSLSAARRLATGSSFTEAGLSGEPGLLWGSCAGSGKKPYQVCVDLAEPAYKCSCPSRKFPCKHALALLLRWSAGQVPQAEPAPFAAEWQSQRTKRAETKVAREQAPRTEAQEAAAARRAAQRTARVEQGAEELARWLDDHVAGGIAGLGGAGYEPFDRVAARLVDAQAPGLASMVRRCGSVAASGPGWEDRLLAELGLLRLLVSAVGRVDGLPAPLAATVRSRVGLAPTTEEVLAGPAERDVWQVLGVRDTSDERLAARAAWLRARTSGAVALVLSFAAPGQALPADLVPGTEVDADLCRYPGSLPLRAVVRTTHGPARPVAEPEGAVPLAEALDRLAAALGADPWLDRYPLLVRGSLLPGRPWRLVSEGTAVPLDARQEPWALHAASGGHEATLAVEWTPQGLVPLGAFAAGVVTTAGAVAA